MGYPILAIWEPKDVISLLVGLVLGYLVSVAQSRFDRFRQTMERAAKTIDAIRDGIHASTPDVILDARIVPSCRLEESRFDLAVQGHAHALAIVDHIVFDMEMVHDEEDRAASALPDNDHLLRRLSGDRRAVTRFKIITTHIGHRDEWQSRLLDAQPDWLMLLPMSRFVERYCGGRPDPCRGCPNSGRII